jgi:hypothetical protein
MTERAAGRKQIQSAVGMAKKLLQFVRTKAMSVL